MKWDKFAEKFPNVRSMKYLTDLVGDTYSSTSSPKSFSLASALSMAKDLEKQKILSDFLMGEIRHILGSTLTVELEENHNFLALGFDSLMAMELRNRLKKALGEGYSKAIPPTLILSYPSINQVVDYVLSQGPTQINPQNLSTSNSSTLGAESSAPRKKSGCFPLTPFQDRIHQIYESNPSDTSYNVNEIYRVKGALNLTRFQESVNEVIRVNESLRTVFVRGPNGVEQMVLPRQEYVANIRKSDAPLTEVMEEVLREMARPYNFEKGPLYRIVIVELGSDDYLIALGFQHIVVDGIATGLFKEQLKQAYEHPGSLKASKVQYQDYVEWAVRQNYEAHKEYWRTRLKDVPSTFRLPTDKPRVSGREDDYFGDWICEFFEMDTTLYRNMGALARTNGCTPFVAMLTVIQIFLHKLTGERKVCVCIPVTTRKISEGFEKVIGPILSYLFYLGDVSPDKSFIELLNETALRFSKDIQYQDIPFELLFETIWPERPKTFYPICHTFLNFLPESKVYSLGEATFENIRIDSGGGDSDLLFQITELKEKVRLIFHYNALLFERKSVFRLFRELEELMRRLSEQSDTLIKDILKD